MLNGEVVLLKEITNIEGMYFDYFQVGEGYVDHLFEVRVKITTDSYIHIKADQIQVNRKEDWPLGTATRIRHFKLIVKEI